MGPNEAQPADVGEAAIAVDANKTPPVAPETGVITREAVTQIETQKREVWKKTMDEIRASRDAQGDYFAQYGQPGEKNDALVLIGPGPNLVSAVDFVAFTQDGPVVITGTDNNMISGVDAAVLARAKGEDGGKNIENGYHSDTPGKAYIDIPRHSEFTDCPVTPVTDPRIIKQFIDASLARAESPGPKKLAAATASIEMAGQVSSLIQGLPPRV